MLLQSNTGLPMFKWWSPISFGTWFVGVFSLLAFLAFAGALAEQGALRWSFLRPLHQGVLAKAIAVIGGAFGALVAGYTGILLTVTNRPIWADTTLLGLLFLVSGVSTAAALLMLLGRRASPASLHWLSRMDSWSLWLELLVLVLLVISLGSVAVLVWLNVWGAILVLGVVFAGILIPLLLHATHLLGRLSMPVAALLGVAGGFLLRVVIVMSSELV
jgi:formate-dependent nitrite reductase membrane component NrfD